MGDKRSAGLAVVIGMFTWGYGTVVGVARFVGHVKWEDDCASSDAFLDDRGRPSWRRRVRPTVFLYQLYICSRKRGSGSVTPSSSSGSPKVLMNSAARSSANFLASPRTVPCVLRSNSLAYDRPSQKTVDIKVDKNKDARKMAFEKSNLGFSICLGCSGFVSRCSGIARRHHRYPRDRNCNMIGPGSTVVQGFALVHVVNLDSNHRLGGWIFTAGYRCIGPPFSRRRTSSSRGQADKKNLGPRRQV